MNPDQQTVASWVVNAVQLGVMGLVAFFAKNAFTDFKVTLEAVAGKVDALGATVSKADGDRRVSEAKHEALEKRVEKLERLVEELSEGIAR